MLHSVILINKASGVCLFNKNYTVDFDSQLFSGFLTAVQNFAEDLKIGRLTNFVTNDKTIILSASEHVGASLIIDLEDNIDDWFDKAYKIMEKFEEKYNLSNFAGNVSAFQDFDNDLSKILASKEKDFMLEIAKWAKKEFGGELQVNVSLKPSKSKPAVKIEVLLDRGEIDKRKFQDKVALHRFQWLGRDLIFIRAVDGIVGRGEIRDFMENLQNFGGSNSDEVEPGVFPFFPKMAVIIGRDFSETVADLNDRLYKLKGDRHSIQSKYLNIAPPLAKMDIFNCWVEYWKWKEPYPERIFK
ncbi:MAG: hypothetical protein LUQ65_10230 [Candidatus Helarchaeota archaeon]|nr:hypothetical protein [Candidatus Helarchaeota archaeon]